MEIYIEVETISRTNWITREWEEAIAYKKKKKGIEMIRRWKEIFRCESWIRESRRKYTKQQRIKAEERNERSWRHSGHTTYIFLLPFSSSHYRYMCIQTSHSNSTFPYLFFSFPRVYSIHKNIFVHMYIISMYLYSIAAVNFDYTLISHRESLSSLKL